MNGREVDGEAGVAVNLVRSKSEYISEVDDSHILLLFMMGALLTALMATAASAQEVGDRAAF